MLYVRIHYEQIKRTYVIWLKRWAYILSCAIRANVVTGIGLGLAWTNQTHRYNITTSLIGWAHTQNDAWFACFLRGLQGTLWRHQTEEFSALPFPSVKESTGLWWISHTKGQSRGPLMFLCCQSEQTVKQTLDWPVIWDEMTVIWRHRHVLVLKSNNCKKVLYESDKFEKYAVYHILNCCLAHHTTVPFVVADTCGILTSIVRQIGRFNHQKWWMLWWGIFAKIHIPSLNSRICTLRRSVRIVLSILVKCYWTIL